MKWIFDVSAQDINTKATSHKQDSVMNTLENPTLYSEIPLLRPPKIRTFYQLKTLF